MTLIPLKLPAGVYRNGTEFEASNRWRDANLVRWVENTMRPVGGWEDFASVDVSPIRGMLAWRSLGGERRIATGSYNKLYAVLASGAKTDITPTTGFTAGTVNAELTSGYGSGLYGVGNYQTSAATPSGTYGEATTWSMDNWGEYLVACSTADGQLLEWDLTASEAAPITNAPTENTGLMVTEERFLFAFGGKKSGESYPNPRRVIWSDREDNTTWTASTTNEAGDIELQTNGQIMQGIRTRGQALILTDMDAHSATYIGGQFVYSFQRVGSSCGAISRKAAATVDEGVFWMGRRGFFAYSGGSVVDIPCEVSDYVFNDMNVSQQSKIFAVANQAYNEIWWFYQSASSTEIDRYVAYSYKEQHWSIGTLSRTAGVDQGVFKKPIMADANGDTFTHEIGSAYDSASIYAESGPISLGNGDNVLKASMLYPDEKTQGDVTATFKTRFYPNDTEYSHGPYTMSNPTPVRFTGRQIRMRIDAARTNDWRVGIMRLDAIEGGKR